MYSRTELNNIMARSKKIIVSLLGIVIICIAAIGYLSSSLLSAKADVQKDFDWVTVVAAINCIEIPLGLTEKEQAIIALTEELKLIVSEAKVNSSFTMTASKKIEGIKKGISKKRVLLILGEPDYIENEKDYSSHTEMWMYGTSSRWASGTSFVTFKKNKLYRWELKRRR